jgi:hypothetical protein
MTRPPRGAFGIAVGVVAVVAVIAGLAVIGRPGRARDQRLDARRVDDLRELASAVDLYWSREQRLPETRGALLTLDGEEPGLNDPVTRRPYEYRAVSVRRFELCAEFVGAETETDEQDFWRHPSGRHCYEMTVEPAERERAIPTPRPSEPGPRR